MRKFPATMLNRERSKPINSERTRGVLRVSSTCQVVLTHAKRFLCSRCGQQSMKTPVVSRGSKQVRTRTTAVQVSRLSPAPPGRPPIRNVKPTTGVTVGGYAREGRGALPEVGLQTLCGAGEQPSIRGATSNQAPAVAAARAP